MLKENLKKFRLFSNPEVAILIPLILIILIISLLNPKFIHINNVKAMLRGLSFWGIVAIGQTLVVLVGGFDVSIGAVAGFASIFSAWLMVTHNINFFVSIIITLILTSFIGFFNGICVVKFKISAFIVTIGTMYIARSLAQTVNGARYISNLPKIFTNFGMKEPLGLSVAFFVFIGLLVIFEFILRKSVLGRYIYAAGDNKEVAKLAGVNTNMVVTSMFTISGFLAGISGLLLTAQFGTGQAQFGIGWELLVISAVAMGGISLIGGAGSMIGTLIGIVLLVVINNGLILLNVNEYVQNIILGLFMISAVTFDVYRRGKKFGTL